MGIKEYLLDNSNYRQADEYSSAKSAIILHHTVSGGTPEQVVDNWNNYNRSVGTCYVIGRDGRIIKAFNSSKDWAYHLGENTPHWPLNDKRSIGIELVAYGGLVIQNDKWHNVYGNSLSTTEVDVIDAPFRGFAAFHKYTEIQVASLVKLLDDLCSYYGIRRQFAGLEYISNADYRFEFNGIMSHTNFRADKSDIYPSDLLLNEINKFCNL